jgi:chromosome segregation ATPase
MLKNTLIIALVIVLIYLYYQQNKKTNFITGNSPDLDSQNELTQTKSANQTLISFLRDNLNSNNLEELKTKLGEKTLNELLEENEDYETEIDTLTRTKNSLEADLIAQSNAFQNRLREKDREVKKAKEDLTNLEKRHQKASENLTSEKQQHKGSLERIGKLTEQITSLEKERTELKKELKKMPGEFPEAEDKSELASEHQEQLRKVKDFRE